MQFLEKLTVKEWSTSWKIDDLFRMFGFIANAVCQDGLGKERSFNKHCFAKSSSEATWKKLKKPESSFTLSKIRVGKWTKIGAKYVEFCANQGSNKEKKTRIESS